MTFPSISDYKDALQTAADSFRTLTYLVPVAGQYEAFYFSSGNFAVVFKMRDTQTGKLKALKCFIRDQERRAESLNAVSTYLDTVQSPYLVPSPYLAEELWANNADMPVLLMDWVEGVTLGEKVQQLCAARDTEGLHRLSVAFAKMALWLLAQDWAHGDLKHDNIIVRPDDALVLVDYDGAFVPPMAGQNAREIGSPCYRHPQRTAAHFDRHIDDFSILVIFLSLRALVRQPEWFAKHHNGENIVLATTDFGKASPVLQALRDGNDNILRGCIGLLAFALAMPSGKVFGLVEGVLLPFFEENREVLLPKKVVLVFERTDDEPLRLEVDRNIEVLDLEERGIKTFPIEIGQLINLTSLYLRGNKLTQLPTEIGKLTSLTSLNLTGENCLISYLA